MAAKKKKKKIAPKPKKPTKPTKKKVVAKKKKAKPAPAKKAAKASKKTPWQRIKYDDGAHGLFFSIDVFDSLDAEKLFEAADAYPNGYGWESVIVPQFEKTYPVLSGLVSFDSEADMFVARSDEAAHLDALEKVIAAITADVATLNAALKERDPDRD